MFLSLIRVSIIILEFGIKKKDFKNNSLLMITFVYMFVVNNFLFIPTQPKTRRIQRQFTQAKALITPCVLYRYWYYAIMP